MIALPINTQPVERADYREDASLDVVDVFLTIQGEGPLSGVPAVFVRLAGCNLLCPQCDTDYTSKRDRVFKTSLLDEVQNLAKNPIANVSLVVITGGEPFRQNIIPFVRGLLNLGYMVQIETNGTMWLPLFPVEAIANGDCQIICSPKTPSINKGMSKWIHSYKYVVRSGATDSRDGLPTSVLGRDNGIARPPEDFVKGRIFIAPEDDKDPTQDAANLDEALAVCTQFGYRLSVQLHKFLGLP